MNKPVKIIVIIFGLISLLVSIGYGVLVWALSPRIPKPVSDVPIEYKIGWWARQDGLKVTSLETKIISDNLNLFNGIALVEYKLGGTIQYQAHWRPYINSVHISERWLQNSVSDHKGLIEITPLVGTKEDENYAGDSIPFDIKVQDYLKTGGWGRNHYLVRSQNKEAVIVLHQSK